MKNNAALAIAMAVRNKGIIAPKTVIPADESFDDLEPIEEAPSTEEPVPESTVSRVASAIRKVRQKSFYANK